MSRKPTGELRRGWTTGACATAATKAALSGLWGGDVPKEVSLVLPRGETPTFQVYRHETGSDWSKASVIKDAGDDPDVTHGVEVEVRVSASDGGVVFRAGQGIGTVTKAGLPVDVGEPAINPVPRLMMDGVVADLAVEFGKAPDVTIEVSIPDGAQIALKTWNPRLGIKGGLSILGTTGVVRPFSCAAWIASIHRGIDVARADGLTHVAGCTGATSERVVQAEFDLPDHAMLDMGDFAGGLLKYLAKHPIERLTIGGGFGKLTKLAQGAIDLHSSRSQVDFNYLAQLAGRDEVRGANTAMEAVTLVPELAELVAVEAQIRAAKLAPDIKIDVTVVSRDGRILGQSA